MKYPVVSFDCESNGLHGEIFAIGAVMLPVGNDPADRVQEFEGRCAVYGEVDKWVEDNVLPFIGSLTLYPSARALRDAFWDWLQVNKKDAVIIADFGVPVEANLLAACQKDDPSRAFNHPYPLHELGTMLLAAGIDPDINRETYANNKYPYSKHNPLSDAYIAATCWKRAVDTIEKPKQTIASGLEMLDKAGVWTGLDDDLLDRLSMVISEARK